MKSCFATLLLVLTASAVHSLPTAELPSAEKLKTWDDKFKPGLYGVQEFRMNPKTGVPIPKSVVEKQQCLSTAEMNMVSRAAIVGMALGNCVPSTVELKDDSFMVQAACVEEGKMTTLQSMLAISADGAEIQSYVLKGTQSPKKQPVITYAVGSTMKRLGDCLNP